MARSVAVIQNQIRASLAGTPIAVLLNNTSMVSIYNLMIYVVSVGINLWEQLADNYVTTIEAIVANAVPGTPPWIQAQALLFQYNATTPDFVAVDPVTFAVEYPIPNPSDRIIGNCAVVVGPTGIVIIKVTTGTPPGPISSPEKTALTSYFNTILPAGQTFNIISVLADLLQINGNVYFNGQYGASIQANVIAALNTYIATFSTSTLNGGSFNGIIKVTDIEKVILSVPGVTDWDCSQITATPTGGSPINLVLADQQLLRNYQTYSGYVANDPGNPFSSTLTFIAE